MLTIRAEQMAALREQAIARFAAQMCGHLRRVLPEQSAKLADAALTDWIRSGIDAAGQAGIDREGDVQRWLECDLTLPGGIASQPWSASIRARSGVEGRRKMDWIEARCCGGEEG